MRTRLLPSGSVSTYSIWSRSFEVSLSMEDQRTLRISRAEESGCGGVRAQLFELRSDGLGDSPARSRGRAWSGAPRRSDRNEAGGSSVSSAGRRARLSRAAMWPGESAKRPNIRPLPSNRWTNLAFQRTNALAQHQSRCGPGEGFVTVAAARSRPAHGHRYLRAGFTQRAPGTAATGKGACGFRHCWRADDGADGAERVGGRRDAGKFVAGAVCVAAFLSDGVHGGDSGTRAAVHGEHAVSGGADYGGAPAFSDDGAVVGDCPAVECRRGFSVCVVGGTHQGSATGHAARAGTAGHAGGQPFDAAHFLERRGRWMG
jgi:hypothetical protein